MDKHIPLQRLLTIVPDWC
jgi:hypothetical protein